MSITKENLVQAVANLNEMTRERRIKWHVCESPVGRNALAAMMRQSYSYCAPYRGRTLRITENRAVSLTDQIERRSPDREPSSQNLYSLEILDENGTALYQFPTVQGIADVFQTVRVQLADVDEVINSLLAGNPG